MKYPNQFAQLDCCTPLCLAFAVGALAFSAELFAQEALQEFRYVLNEDGAPVARSQIRIPDHLRDAVQNALTQLSKPYMNQWGALVFTVLSEDGKMLKGTSRLRANPNGSGEGTNTTDLIEDDPVVRIGPHGQLSELSIQSPGYQTFTRRLVFRKGEIQIWDDIVLDRVRPGDGASLVGRVFLEDGVDAVGLPVFMDNQAVGRTDENGEFKIDDLSAGEVTIYSRKHWYAKMQKKVILEKGKQTKCELEGYRLRGMRIRWSRTSLGSSSFRPAAESGTNLIFPESPGHYSFRDGLHAIEDYKDRDFTLQQKKDTVIFAVAVAGEPGTGVIRAQDSFDRVLVAPEGSYSMEEINPKVGNVYVLSTPDASYYAKFEVLEIFDSIDPD